VTAEIVSDDVPTFGKEIVALASRDCVPGGTRTNLEFAESFTVWNGTSAVMRVILCDAQTSGGLLLCVPRRHLNAVRTILKKHGASSSAVIGRILRGPARVHVI
jgi:selenophosphate synthase